MAYDESLAGRVRALLPQPENVQERKMFGGLAFLVNGHMACGIVRDLLMVRIHPDSYDEALDEPHVRPMDFTGRPMRGFVYVEPAGLGDRPALELWVRRGLAFASSLPPK